MKLIVNTININDILLGNLIIMKNFQMVFTNIVSAIDAVIIGFSRFSKFHFVDSIDIKVYFVFPVVNQSPNTA